MTTSFGQDYIPNYLLQSNAFIDNNFDIIDPSGWFQAKPESNLSPEGFLTNNKQYFGMGSDDNFVLIRETNDDYPFMEVENRFTHTRYNQTYKDVKVEFAEIFLHHKNNRIEIVNGKLAEGLAISVTPAFTEAQALTAAINHLGSNNVYSWQDSEYEAAYQEEKEDATATTYPTGQLLIAKVNASTDYSSGEFKLAWKYRIISLTPSFDVTIYMDAHTGAFIKQESNIQDGHGDLSYNYGNNAYIDTRWRGGFYSHHVLRSDDANSPKIWTKKWIGSNIPFGGYNCVTGCTPNSFDNDDTWYDASVITPHWAATHAWNYFRFNFNRNGYDNNNTEVKILGNAAIANSGWNGSSGLLQFGQINGNHLGTRDYVGHEFTHAVTQYTAGLVYQNEPGALNESFSDIFGYEIERAINGGNHLNWDIGEDVSLARRMNNPSNSAVIACPNHNQSQPAFYNGARWYNGTCDDGGVHINSGVQNYWFYLLTQGSNGAPDGTLNSVVVTGIGANAARNIAYYNLDNFLGNNSVYLDAELGSMLAASLIYGNCSNESNQTRNAWAAVDSRIAPHVPLSVTGPNLIFLFSNGTIWGSMPKNYTATGGVRRRITWTGPSAWTWNLNSNFPRQDDVFTVTNFNNNHVNTTLTASDGCVTLPYTIYFTSLKIANPDFGEPRDIIFLSPNPTTSSVTIDVVLLEADQADPISIVVTDITGGVWFDQTYSNGILPASFDFSNLAFGNYIVTATQSGYSVQAQLSKDQ